MALLKFRRLEREDLPSRVDWFNAPSVSQQMTVEAPLSFAGTNQWFTTAVLDSRRRDFSVVLHDSEVETLAAMGGLTDIDAKHNRAELYILVNPTMTSRGIGRRTVQWLCDFGFIQLHLSRIYLTTLHSNDGARRLYERLGFVCEGRLRRHIYHGGEFVDRYIHGLLKEEWERSSWRSASPISLSTSWEIE